MWPKKIIFEAIFSLFLILIAFIGFAQNQHEKLPNILLFHADDMTWRDCGSYGNPDVITPQISKLAEEGMCFDNMHNTTAMCAPTRMMLYSGLYPVRNGAYPNHSMVYSGVKSLVHYFNNLDYRVALIGKVHHEPFRSFPFEFLGGRHHDDGNGVDIHLERIKPLLQQDNPFFLVVSSNQPHTPWNRGPVNQYNKDEIEVPDYLIDSEKTREDLVKYYAEITYTDSLLGVCMNYLEEAGKADNTIVIFTSEQGSSFPFAKWTCYDLGLKTAFIVKWPEKIEPETRNSALTQYVDVLPTLLDAVGKDPESINTGITDSHGKSDFDGKSFLSVLLGEKQTHREYVFGLQTTRGIFSGSICFPVRSVRSNRYKYIVNLNSGSNFYNLVVTRTGGIYQQWLAKTLGNERRHEYVTKYQVRPKEELYDVKNDPFEMHNLVNVEDLETVKNELKNELFKWMKQQGDKGIETEMNALKRQVPEKKESWMGYEEEQNNQIFQN
ncbi:sulfatase family protein [Maribellus comscasis]|nr:sulfatase [Maribellus comscasis]